MRTSAFLIVLLVILAAIGGAAWFGFSTYRDIVEIEKTGLRPPTAVAREEGGATGEATVSARPRGDSLDAAVAAEEKGRWKEALGLYRAAKEKAGASVAEHVEALEEVLRGEESEKKGNAGDALLSYRKAIPVLGKDSPVQARIKRLEQAVRYKHMMDLGLAAEEEGRWQEAADAFHEAKVIAPQADIPTVEVLKKIQQNRARAAELEKALDGYYWLIEACRALKDPYALVAALDYYSEQEVFRGLSGEMERLRAGALREIGVKGADAAGKSPETKRARVKVQLKNGTSLEGTLVAEDDRAVVVSELRKETIQNRFVLRADIEAIQKEVPTGEASHDEKAQVLLAEVAKACADQPSVALGKLGRLLHEYGDAAILKDPARQRQVIVKVSLKTSREYGDSVSKLLAANVKFLENVCAVCLGAGRPVCPDCGGTGSVLLTCSHCRGKGMALCGACGGIGKLISGDGAGPVDAKALEAQYAATATCKVCKGKGVRVCGQCQGEGSYRTVCLRCKNGHLPTCPACHGAGKRPHGKFRPSDQVGGGDAAALGVGKPDHRPLPQPSGHAVEADVAPKVVLRNMSGVTVTVTYTGPTPQGVTLAPGESRTLSLVEGEYEVTAKARGETPHYGRHVYRNSFEYQVPLPKP